MITDCHIHISPIEMFKPAALELMKRTRPDFARVVEYIRSHRIYAQSAAPEEARS